METYKSPVHFMNLNGHNPRPDWECNFKTKLPRIASNHKESNVEERNAEEINAKKSNAEDRKANSPKVGYDTKKLKVHEKGNFKLKNYGAALPAVRKMLKQIDEDILKELGKPDDVLPKRPLRTFASSGTIRSYVENKRAIFYANFAKRAMVNTMVTLKQDVEKQSRGLGGKEASLYRDACQFRDFLKYSSDAYIVQSSNLQTQIDLHNVTKEEQQLLSRKNSRLRVNLVETDEALMFVLKMKRFLLLVRHNYENPLKKMLTTEWNIYRKQLVNQMLNSSISSITNMKVKMSKKASAKYASRQGALQPQPPQINSSKSSAIAAPQTSFIRSSGIATPQASSIKSFGIATPQANSSKSSAIAAPQTSSTRSSAIEFVQTPKISTSKTAALPPPLQTPKRSASKSVLLSSTPPKRTISKSAVVASTKPIPRSKVLDFLYTSEEPTTKLEYPEQWLSNTDFIDQGTKIIEPIIDNPKWLLDRMEYLKDECLLFTKKFQSSARKEADIKERFKTTQEKLNLELELIVKQKILVENQIAVYEATCEKFQFQAQCVGGICEEETSDQAMKNLFKKLEKMYLLTEKDAMKQNNPLLEMTKIEEACYRFFDIMDKITDTEYLNRALRKAENARRKKYVMDKENDEIRKRQEALMKAQNKTEFVKVHGRQLKPRSFQPKIKSKKEERKKTEEDLSYYFEEV